MLSFSFMHPTGKKKHMFRLIVCSILTVCLSLQMQGQQKRALLIGVGSYPAELGWSSLSAKNDIEYLKNVLPLKGFDPSKMQVLLNEQATKAGIERAFSKLISESGAGDIIMVHFSGHGQQITDDSDDEPDGFDEAWIPIDAQARYMPTPRPSAPAYRGELHLRDDEIGRWLDSLSRKVGQNGSILVSIDACHSGTATRSASLGKVRGDPEPFKIPGKKNELIKTGMGEQDEFIGGAAMGRGNIVTISASSPTQVNRETVDANQQGVGSLTYALSKALEELPEGANYSDLFFRVKAMIQAWIPLQFPMMEGNGKQQVFAGHYSSAGEVKYVDRWADDTSVTIKMGSLLEISPGAEFILKDPQTGKQVATAVATKVSLVETMATVSNPLDKTKPWVVEVKSLPVSPFRLKIGYDTKKMPAAWVSALDKAIAGYGFAEKSDNPDCWITYLKDTGMVVVTKYDDMAYTDTKVANGKLDQAALEALKKPLQSIARTEFFRSLPDGGPLQGKAILELKAKDGRKSNDNSLSFKKGDKFDFILKNKGTKVFYYSIVVVTPNGEMQVLLPRPQDSPQNWSLQPGSTREIPDFEIEESPGGREFFKVVVSENPDFDIRPLFTKMDKKRAGISSWEQAMIDIMQPEPGTLPKKRSVQVNDVTLITQSYQIIHE